MSGGTLLRKLAAAVIAAALLAGFFVPRVLASSELKTVRVGFFAFDGYHMTDKNGNRSGYGYEYLQRMSKYNNWRYKYVGEDKSWREMQEMLAGGEIDILTPAHKTEERLARFDFSDEPIGISTTIFTIRAGNGAFPIGDFSALDGVRVGMLKGNAVNGGFARYAAKNGFAYRPVYFDSDAEMLAALQDGKIIDALVTSNLRVIRREWVVAEFDPKPFYAMVRKGDGEMLKEVNAAIKQVNTNNTTLQAMLRDKYYSPDSGEDIPFTAGERLYLQKLCESASAVNVLMNPARRPLSYVEDGEMRGIIPQIAAAVFERLDIPYTAVVTTSREEYFAAARAPETTVYFDMRADYNLAEKNGYKLTEPYLRETISQIRRTGFSGEIETVAVLRLSDIPEEYLHSLCGGARLIYFDEDDECVRAVRDGRADVTYRYTYRAQEYMYHDVRNELQSVLMPKYRTYFAVGVRAAANPLLLSIINKGVQAMRDEDINAIILNNTLTVTPRLTLADFFYQYRFPAVLLGVMSLLLLALAAALFAIRQRSYNKIAAKNDALAAAVAQAKYANEAKGRFLSSMSHEIRTPMNAIVGITEIAKAHIGEPERIANCLAKIETSSRLLLNIVNDVLDMSAIERAKLKIASAEFDIKDVLTNLSNIYYPQCAEKGVKFDLVANIDDEMLIGDQLRVSQILMNLVSNAFKFTPAGGRIKVIAAQTVRNGENTFIRFTVSDTGIGMSKEFQAKLFSSFEQEDAETARRYGGSGLGLAITKNLVGLMHGAIDVASEPDKGTVVTVDLPFKVSGERTSRRRASVSGQLRALVADDDTDAVEYISIVLERLGVQYDTACSGNLAIEMTAKEYGKGGGYNVCFLDWKMPDVSGLEVTRKIRELYDKDTLIIVVSAYDLSEIEEEAKAAGANMLLQKPLFQSTVSDLITDLICNVIRREAPGGAAKYDFGGKKLLLAEDNDLNAEISLELLEMVHIRADRAADGRQAVEMMTSSAPGTYEMILMDIQMPVMDGYEAARAIRASAHPQAASIPIYAMTANAFSEDVSAALSAGMNGHIAKPIDTRTLYETIKRATGRAGDTRIGRG